MCLPAQEDMMVTLSSYVVVWHITGRRFVAGLEYHKMIWIGYQRRKDIIGLRRKK